MRLMAGAGCLPNTGKSDLEGQGCDRHARRKDAGLPWCISSSSNYPIDDRLQQYRLGPMRLLGKSRAEIDSAVRRLLI